MKLKRKVMEGQIMRSLGTLFIFFSICVLLVSPGYAGETIPFAQGQVWNGTYGCGKRLTEFNLIIDRVDGKQIEALFHFTWNKNANPYTRFGLFSLVGEYSEPDNSLFLKAKKIIRPNNFSMINLTGSYNQSNKTYAGDTSCRGTFSVQLSGILDDFPKLAQAIHPSVKTPGKQVRQANQHSSSGSNPQHSAMALLTAKQLFDMMQQGKIEQAKMLYTQQYKTLLIQRRARDAAKLKNKFTLAAKAFNEVEKLQKIKTENNVLLTNYPINPDPIDCINKKICEQSYEVTPYGITMCSDAFQRKLSLIKKNRDNLDAIRLASSAGNNDTLSELLEKINYSGATSDDIQETISSYAEPAKTALKKLSLNKKAVFLGVDLSEDLSRSYIKKVFEKNGAVLEEKSNRTDVYDLGGIDSFKDVKAICFFSKKKLLRRQKLIEITLSYPKYQETASLKQVGLSILGESFANILGVPGAKDQVKNRINAEMQSGFDRKQQVWNTLIKNYGGYHEKKVIEQKIDPETEQRLAEQTITNLGKIIVGFSTNEYYDGYKNPNWEQNINTGREGFSGLGDQLLENAKSTLTISIFKWIVDHGNVAIYFMEKGQNDASLASIYPDRFYTISYRNIGAFKADEATKQK